MSKTSIDDGTSDFVKFGVKKFAVMFKVIIMQIRLICILTKSVMFQIIINFSYNGISRRFSYYNLC